MFSLQAAKLILEFKFPSEHASTAGNYAMEVFGNVYFGFSVSLQNIPLLVV